MDEYPVYKTVSGCICYFNFKYSLLHQIEVVYVSKVYYIKENAIIELTTPLNNEGFTN